MSMKAQIQKNDTARGAFVPVSRGLLQRKCACGGTPGVDGECAECRAKRLSMQHSTANQATPSVASPIVLDVLRSPGQSLDTATRAFMEPRFGHDFSQVRVHTDARATESARSVNALAYTVGRDVVFDHGQYAPGTLAGQKLLAHELTHVVQQAGMGESVRMQKQLQVGRASDPAEREAEVQATSIVDNAEMGNALPQRQALLEKPEADISKAPRGMKCAPVTGRGHRAGTDIFFDISSSDIPSKEDVKRTIKNRKAIEDFKENWIRSGSRDDVIVDGYASADGPQSFNWQLSCERAEQVKDELKTVIPEQKITRFAHGETDEFSTTSYGPNRHAIISSVPTPPAPGPTPPAPGPTPPGPGPSTLPAKIKFWINAFIPNTLGGAFRASAGPFAGRQVFKAPPLPFHYNSCFETDDRGFTSSLPASSRLHLEIEFDTSSKTLTFVKSADPTFEIDCTTGAVKCFKPSFPSISVVLAPPLLPGSSLFDILIDGTNSDPCVFGSLDIAIRGDVQIDLSSRTFKSFVFTTLFPAIEMYVSFGTGTPTTLFTMPPSGSSVFFLAPPGVVPHTSTVRF